jgi:hypothetical protein
LFNSIIKLPLLLLKMNRHIYLLLILKCISGSLNHYQILENQQNPLPSPCFGRRPARFLDEITTKSICSDAANHGFVHRFGTNQYYSSGDLQMTWIDGETYCQSFGAHLPVVLNDNDQNFLRCKR